MVRSNRNVCWLMMDLYGAYFRFRMLQIDQLHSHNMTYKFLIENRPLWQPLILHGTVFFEFLYASWIYAPSTRAQIISSLPRKRRAAF